MGAGMALIAWGEVGMVGNFFMPSTSAYGAQSANVAAGGKGGGSILWERSKTSLWLVDHRYRKKYCG